MSAAELVPITLRDARRYVAAHHRHNEPPRGHKWSIGLQRDDQLVGVVIASSPIARAANDGRTIELIRVTTEGDRNACSRLYAAACRAAAAMGYRRVITYTLAEEPGTSLRAAGFVEDARLDARPGWEHTSGPRAGDMPRLFDEPKMPTGPKIRWLRSVA